MRKKFFSLLVLLAAVLTSAMAQEESLLTTLTLGGSETYGETTSGVVTVTATNVGLYNGTYGWLLDEGGSLSVTAKEGYTITKCVFHQNAKTPITDTEAPFEIHANDWGGIIEDPYEEMNGVTSIEVYGYANAGGGSTATVVTITDSDFPGWGDSFTKDGVTVSAEMIDDMYGNISGPGSFSTTLGNFTKIEVNAGYIGSLGEGWSGNSEHKTWTGNASSVSFTGDINGDEEGVTLKFTIEPASTPEPAKYYIVGSMNSWAVDENYEMNPNIYAETEEYFYALDLTTTSEFKVVKVEGENQTWYPTGMDNNYGQNGEITEDAEYTIYFRPNYDGGEDWFYNCIYVSKNEPQGETITVTWYSYDLPSSGSSFTKDGVTLTCDIDDDLYGPGTFTTDLGNFTQIVVSGEEACYIDATDGWSGNTDQKTWTGNAAIVPFNGSIYSFSSDVTIVFTIEPSGGETAVDNIQIDKAQSTKLIRNGMLLIEKNGKLFNVTGAQVK